MDDDMVYLIDGDVLFGRVLAEVMEEHGLTLETCTKSQLKCIIRETIRDEFIPSWSDFIAWVTYGDDRKARTLAMLRGDMALNHAWRKL